MQGMIDGQWWSGAQLERCAIAGMAQRGGAWHGHAMGEMGRPVSEYPTNFHVSTAPTTRPPLTINPPPFAQP